MVLTPLLLFATAIKRLMFVSVLLSFVLGEPETWHSIFQLSFMEPVGAKILTKKSLSRSMASQFCNCSYLNVKFNNKAGCIFS
uniref:Putative secreted protein n=1 Tax=Rhipicephalus microplus TaxID=6941 RepID=A0A6G5A1L9_RHIMP